jgi:hypothetical protein
LKIPKSIKINGMTITIEETAKPMDNNIEMGEYNSNNKHIRYLKAGGEINGDKIAQDVSDHTYCHELAHCFSDIFGYEDLYKDEKFADDLGYFLKQLLEQMK